MKAWFISTRHLRNPLQNRLAHTLNEHVGYGWYKTSCGRIRISVEERQRVEPPTVETEKGYCPRCRKLFANERQAQAQA